MPPWLPDRGFPLWPENAIGSGGWRGGRRRSAARSRLQSDGPRTRLEMFPDGRDKIVSRYGRHQRQSSVGKGRPMPDPKVFLSKMVKTFTKKLQSNSLGPSLFQLNHELWPRRLFRLGRTPDGMKVSTNYRKCAESNSFVTAFVTTY